ncbi:MAG: cbb3-type cytochrome c oxidase subunit I [Rhodospirillaceae bacterium]|nr:cbb3-type cytochrome c oxidase subunit I [Rhodospirillaceae bacterium]
MKPMTPLMERLSPALDDYSVRKGLYQWIVLGISAIAIAGAFALLLAFSRIPGIQDIFPWPLDFFKKGLVVHVVFSFVVFFLSVFAAVAHITAARLGNGRPKFPTFAYGAYRLTIVAFVFLFVPAWMNRGQPMLNNYVPVITDPLYYMALMALGIAMALMAFRVILNFPIRKKNRPKKHGMGLDILTLSGVGASVFYLFAFAYVMIAWTQLGSPDGPPDHQYNEELFWAGGHVMQFVNVAITIGAWFAVGAAVYGRAPFNPMVVVACIGVLALGVFITPLFFIIWESFSAGWLQAFSDLQYIFAFATLPVALVAFMALPGLIKSGFKPWHNPGVLAVTLSPIVFGMGGIMGLFVDGHDTRTPGHYHAMIAGVTLAFIGLYFSIFLPLIRRQVAQRKLAFATVWMFFIGQGIAAIGLFIAGGHGTARKVAGAEQGLSSIGAKIGMGLNGGGGLLAVIGGAFFVWIVATALLKKPSSSKETMV